MNLEEFLTLATKEEASDLFIVAGLPLTMKVNGVMRRINEEKMMPQDTEKIIREIYEKALDRDIDQLLKTGDDDFSFAIPGLSRFRVSAYKQRGSLAAVIRVIAFRLPDYKQLRIPEQVMKLSELNKGLVLVTGPAGSGKSTTLACMIEEINETKEDHIISAASCTTNCLAPMAKALNDLAPIKSGIMCTIHAYTGDQMTLDGPQRKGDLRRSRAAAVNIVPNSTGAAKAIGLVIPELNGKLIGSAQRVPTPTGSTTILTAVVEGNVTKEQINAAMKAASNESFGYNEDEIVSSDIVGMRFGSLFDATQTMVLPLENGTTEVQVVSWYDNENSYTSQMVRTIKHFGKLLNA